MGLPGHGAIHRAGVDVAIAEGLRQPSRERAFPGARGSVDGDDEGSQQPASVTFQSVPRSLRWLLGGAVLAAAFTVTAIPYLDAAAFIARAADLTGPPATLAAWRASRVDGTTDVSVTTRQGAVPGRIYRPSAGFTRTIVLIPGVHRDGIDEARLVGLAQDLAATGFAVLTVAAPDLQRFRISPAVTDVIEDAVAWTVDRSGPGARWPRRRARRQFLGRTLGGRGGPVDASAIAWRSCCRSVATEI